MRIIWHLLSTASFLLVLVGALVSVFPIANIYAVSFMGIAPGDPLYVDELAVPLRSSLLSLTLIIGISCVAIWLRRVALRKLASTPNVVR